VSDVRVIPFLVSELRLPDAERELLGVEWWPSYGHAVEHPGGIFLFDNGAGFGNAEVDERFSPRVRPVDDALEEAGISLADVTGAANCHLHFDHSGQNARLGGMPIFVQRAEWAKVHEPDYTVPEWIDVPGLTYELLDGEAEVAPGMRLVPTPGHTAGHQSLVLDAPGGAIVLAGQAVQSRAEWQGGEGSEVSGRSSSPDPDAYARSVDRLRALDPIRVHFAHDPAIWQR
jgi:glyoxylase-like metal-dependent hydrolase (beta-lactamase superfamily II)